MSRALLKRETRPVTLWQKYVLDEAVNPDCPNDLRDRMVLANAVLLRPGIDMRRLRRAVTKLRRRHDTLCLRFMSHKGGWLGRVDAPEVDVIREMSLEHLDVGAFYAEISALANGPMSVVDAPLAEVIVVRGGARGDVLITRVHHAITDGHGMVVLTEDLAKFLIGLPVFGRAVSHSDYVARFEQPPPGRAAEIAAFWQEMHHDLPQAPMIGRKAKGMKPLIYGLGEVDQKRLTLRATPASLARFQKRAAQAGHTAVTAMYAGYLEAMCQVYDQEQLAFMASVSRSDPALDTYVGDHTLDPILRYRAAGARTLEAATRALGKTMVEAMGHMPSDAARRGGPYEAGLVARGIYPRQFVVEQPRALSRQTRSVFSGSFSLKPGTEQRVGPFALRALDVSVPRRKWGEMHFDVSGPDAQTCFRLHYDGMSYDEAEMRRLAVRLCALLEIEPVAVDQVSYDARLKGPDPKARRA